MTEPSVSHAAAVVARRKYEAEQERRWDAVAAMAEERAVAREAARAAEPPTLDPVSVRSRRDGYMTRF